jgi:predicted O-methyltransferase YrrM
MTAVADSRAPGKRRKPLPRFLKAPLRRALRAPTLWVVKRMLADEMTRDRITHSLSDRLAIRESSFTRSVPAELERLNGFEDVVWLLSSNELNHGLSRLRLDEAAYLYRLVRSLSTPRVAELGRYKGGSAFLIAAAGGRVLSMDNGRLPGQESFVPELVAALERFGLRQQVEIVDADARTFPVEPGSFDLVFFDCAYSYATTKTIFEHWWPAVRRGGALLVRDGKDSLLTEAVRYVSEINLAAVGASSDPHAPGAFVLLRRL